LLKFRMLYCFSRGWL